MTDFSPNNSNIVHQSLDAFLASVERRAYKHALFAVRNEENALDIVQDAMFSLVKTYSDKPPAEWPMLFTRILQNAIHNHFRRSKVRNYWTPTFSEFEQSADDEAGFDILENLLARNSENHTISAEDTVSREEMLNIIEELIKNLPDRQREAFLLRYWEELSVIETAEIMGCSEGSVKTHCSRASHSLAKALRELGITS
ncbi:RNA polymerase sigma factor [Hydromonas duriensis]|uniref:RNA polymerase sigma-70 factor (ECF subfamily) n=1 Tax=Hydromonas duriensis TaxID=1527608 RepID=A0A4R6YBP3_9BURK|nr:RNA polymerase sigma factor [Hydromonas duriensis]TDR33063.1 RNA polymerase sigma-70 factor (ECF subfamily) [Hydromonas duriensis]